jgi:hypothetical protein
MRSSLLVAGLAIFLCGCIGYKVGPTNGMEAGSRSIEIAPPVNATLEPRLSDAVAHALRRQIQRDGTYKLDTHGTGDVIVSTRIVEFRRQGVTFDPSDTLTVRDYRLQLIAQVNAFDRVSGKTLVQKQVRGDTMVRIGRDQAGAELQSLPVVAEELARNITSAIVDGDW